jgi:hypothetical protein
VNGTRGEIVALNLDFEQLRPARRRVRRGGRVRIDEAEVGAALTLRRRARAPSTAGARETARAVMRVARVIAKLEPGGAQLRAAACGNRVAPDRRRRDRGRDRAGLEPEVFQERVTGLQWAPSPGFAAWLAPGSRAPISSTRTCSAPGGRRRRSSRPASRWWPASTTPTTGPASRATTSCAARSSASTAPTPTARRRGRTCSSRRSPGYGGRRT